jgi:euchromatic histone-lysine N-methyltransferase
MYLENEDFGDVLYYSGSGDDRAQNTLEHRADQKLDNQGNLALHNSYEYGIEVRVIRGVNCKLHNRGHNKDYIYDGLYRVVSSTFGRDKSGYNVCKFRLLCLPGQAELGSKGWQIAQQLKDTMDDNRGQHLSLRRGYISLDLSKGTETFSIPVCNTVDDDRSPMLYCYLSTLFAPSFQCQSSGRGARPAVTPSVAATARQRTVESRQRRIARRAFLRWEGQWSMSAALYVGAP